MRRGDIYYADLRPVVGSEQGGVRPVLIVQNDVGNRHSPTVICAAITSKTNKTKLPTHIVTLVICADTGLCHRQILAVDDLDGLKFEKTASAVISGCNILSQLGVRACRRPERRLKLPAEDLSYRTFFCRKRSGHAEHRAFFMLL